MFKRVRSQNVQVMLLSWRPWFSGSEAIEVTMHQGSVRIVWLLQSRPSYISLAWPSPLPLLRHVSAKGLTMSVNSSQVTTSTITNHMQWSYTFFLSFMYLMLVLFIQKQKQAPNLVMFQSFSMCQMLLTDLNFTF